MPVLLSHPGHSQGPHMDRQRYGELKGGVYLYLYCFPLQGAVAVITVVGPDQYRVTEQVVLNGHEVAQAGRDHLKKGCELESV